MKALLPKRSLGVRLWGCEGGCEVSGYVVNFHRCNFHASVNLKVTSFAIPTTKHKCMNKVSVDVTDNFILKSYLSERHLDICQISMFNLNKTRLLYSHEDWTCWKCSPWAERWSHWWHWSSPATWTAAPGSAACPARARFSTWKGSRSTTLALPPRSGTSRTCTMFSMSSWWRNKPGEEGKGGARQGVKEKLRHHVTASADVPDGCSLGSWVRLFSWAAIWCPRLVNALREITLRHHLYREL